MARRSPHLVTDYRSELRLWPTRGKQLAVLAAAVLWLALPMQLEDFWLGVMNLVAVFAIGGIGLNLLTGYAGQVSLGTAFFVATGAYSAAWFGGEWGWPMPAWLLASAVLGAAVGALIGPIALRLSGNYLAIVTLGLLFVGEHIFTEWKSVTGGGRGTRVAADLAIGPIDFAALDVGGVTYSREQGLFWLLWAGVAVAALVGANIARSRPGRAMQAVRDRDVAAEVVGVSLARTKVGVFAVSSAMAAVAGGFYGAAVQQFVSPVEFGGIAGLVLSISFIAVIIIGGMGTITGAIVGAFVVGALPRIIQRFSEQLPFLIQGPGDDGILNVSSFNNMLFGLLIIVFLLAEPLGLVALWRRFTTYLKTWPFSY
jgi:branched-chain amino acid transport system permease protein